MAIAYEHSLKRDLVRLGLLITVGFGVAVIFFGTPTLSTPTLLSMLATMILSPFVAALERRGLPRTVAILLIFGMISLMVSFTTVIAAQKITDEWDSFSRQAPIYFYKTIDRFNKLELTYQRKYPVLVNIHPTDSLLKWGRDTGAWFIDNGPKIMSDLLQWFFIVPILTFFLLRDGRAFLKRFYDLVPNRLFEPTFMVTTKIISGLSDYIRARLIEGLLVGLLVMLGLFIIDAPYVLVLGLIAGITNIVPYVGPLLGAAPGILMVFLDPNPSVSLLAISLVYVFANVIDLMFIFPVVVAQLVNLHPLLLIAAVIAGGKYYGLVGMLISIPIATSLKVVFQEIYDLVFERHKARLRNMPTLTRDEIRRAA